MALADCVSTPDIDAGITRDNNRERNRPDNVGTSDIKPAVVDASAADEGVGFSDTTNE
jgi:hypothetical protein